MKLLLNKNKLLNICSVNDISFLALFGSYVHGNDMNESDVDLLVRFSKRKGLLDLVRIEREISDMLGKKVDLVTESSVSPYLIERIRKDMKILYISKQ